MDSAPESAPESGPAADGGLPSLAGLTVGELDEIVAGLGQPAFRVRQLWHWIYHRGATDFAEMTTLAKSLRAELATRYTLARPGVAERHDSVDGTIKWLARFADGNQAETVFIPEPDRGTLCVSSQVGCTLNCSFCHTGTQPMVRNLTAAEIVGQVMLARDALGEWPESSNNRRLTNVVLMGMGEPLYNFDNVKAALGILMDNEGICIGRRRITLSTAGVVPEIARVGAETGAMLAISLHAVTDELRDVLVPLNRKYPIAELLAACRDFSALDNSRRITFEYVLLKGVNDSPADANALAKLLRGIDAKVNLIPFNPWPGTVYDSPTASAVTKFADILASEGYTAPVRRPRGRDIMAACGQLKSASERKKRTRD